MNARNQQRELYNESAERDVLSAATLSRDALFHVLSMDADDFHFEKYRHIFIAMCELNAADVPVTIETLVVKLKKMNVWQKVGEYNLVTEFREPVAAYSVPYLISDIKRKHTERKIRNAANDLVQAVTSGVCDIDESSNKLVRIISDMNMPKESEYKSVDQMADMSFDYLFGKGDYISSKLSSVRRILNFFNGQLITIAARPGVGKSSLALQLAEEFKGRVVYFTLEMKAKHMYARLLAKHAKVEIRKIKENNISRDEFERMAKCHSEIKGRADIMFYDNAFAISKISNIIQRECERDKPSAIIIDYVGLISGGEGNSPYERVGYITKMLKQRALTLDIPIFILCQLNRELEKTNRRPILSDLRDSGSIEQDSDVVIFLWAETKESTTTEFIVAKNRDGDIGFCELFFNKKYTHFQDIERMHIDGPTVPSMDYIHN